MIRHAPLLMWLILCTHASGVDQIQVRDDFDGYGHDTQDLSTVGSAGLYAMGTGWTKVSVAGLGPGWLLSTTTASGGVFAAGNLAPGAPVGGFHLETRNTGFPGRIMRSTHQAVLGAPVWVSFVLKGLSLQAVAQGILSNRNQIDFFSGDWVTPAISLNTAGTRVGNTSVLADPIRWRINSSAPSHDIIADDAVHVVVMKLTDTATTVWFDPPRILSEPIPSASNSLTAALGGLSFDRLHMRVESNAEILGLDDVQVGDSWRAVSDASMPYVTSISPSRGHVSGNTAVTIIGAHLSPTSTVTIGGSAATSVTWLDASVITARTPAGAAGTADVVVTDASAIASATDSYTYAVGNAGDPVSMSGPAISGIPQPGQTLTADPGTWNPAQASFTYQWSRASTVSAAAVQIPGATSSSYAVVMSDVGQYLRVRVTPTGLPASAVDSGAVQVLINRPTAQQLAAMEAVGPRCGAGGGLAALMLGALLWSRRRR